MTLSFKPAVRVKLPIPAWVYENRLLQKVEVDDNGCWRWQASLNRAGYGETFAWKRGWLAHRLAYTLVVGPIPEGYEIDHRCRVRNCINPYHLEAVTQEENKRRQGAAVTHCPRRHEYTPENTFWTPGSSGRKCRECDRANSRRFRANRLGVEQ